MAYPDYSIVVISVTEGGVTTDIVQSFYNDELARKYYNQAVSENKRAFFYEKPKPTKFSRKDGIALIDGSVEKGKESETAVIPSPETEFKVKIKEGHIDININYELFYEDNKRALKGLTYNSITIGQDVWEYWKIKHSLTGVLDFISKKYKERVYLPAGTVFLDAQFSNKRILITHTGSLNMHSEITKLWPDEGEVEMSEPEQVLLEIAGESAVNIGSKVVKKTYGGESQEDYTSEDIYTYVPNGNIILETDTRYYFSDGNGWYRSQIKQDSGGGGEGGNSECTPAGTELGRRFLQDLTYPIVDDMGLIAYATIGSQVEVTTADGYCGSDLTTENSYSAEGTVVYETDTTYYKSNGSGSVYTEAKDTGGDNGGDNGSGNGGDEGGCPQYGTEINSTTSDGPTVNESFMGENFSYVPYQEVTRTIADGNCGEQTLDPERTYIEEGTVIHEFSQNGLNYIIYATTQGGWTYDFGLSTNAEIETYSGDTYTNEDSEFPSTGDGNCPPAGYNRGVSGGWVFKLNAGGQIVGTVTPRTIIVTLPQGLYVSSVLGIGGSMPSNKITFKTGSKWTGRYLPDGNCGWVPEDSENPNSWRIPEGTSFPAGEYANLQTIGTSGTWFVHEFVKMNATGFGATFKTVRVGFRSDGQGNVICYRK